jgi:hypothetical protein
MNVREESPATAAIKLSRCVGYKAVAGQLQQGLSKGALESAQAGVREGLGEGRRKVVFCDRDCLGGSG